MKLLDNERIDDLQINGLKIIQDNTKFRFGCDAVELANFVSGKSSDRAVDLGCGTGIIALLLGGKLGIGEVLAIEIQQCMADMARRSVEMNGLEDTITVHNIAMQNISEVCEKGSATIVVCNPPYRKVDSGYVSEGDSIAISRHEIAVTLAEVVACADYLLSSGGKFYIVNQTERLAETIYLCSKHNLEPKVLQVLTPNDYKEPHLFLLQAKKDAKVGLVVRRERPVRLAAEIRS